MIELSEQDKQGARIAVMGVGGGGGNAVGTMIRAGLNGVDFVATNTDAQALGVNDAAVKIQLGIQLTKGLGAGANPEIGRKAALEQEDLLREELVGSDMVFVTAGMGGGTGTGGAPVIARLAKDLGALTVGVVTKPFSFEGKKRCRVADEGIRELRASVDTLIVIPNQRLIEVSGRTTTAMQAFEAADDVLLQAVRGISQIITEPGLINVDFADVRTIMSEMGMAMMGSGEASGDGRASQAAQDAISSPLLEDINLTNANGILVNVTAGKDLSIGEFQEVGEVFKEIASEDATVVLGTCIDPEMSEGIRVTVVATGLGQSPAFTHQPVRSVTALSSASSAQTNYTDLDKPTVARKRAAEDSPEVLTPGAEELLDVPAFLRRQAD